MLLPPVLRLWLPVERVSVQKPLVNLEGDRLEPLAVQRRRERRAARHSLLRVERAAWTQLEGIKYDPKTTRRRYFLTGKDFFTREFGVLCLQPRSCVRRGVSEASGRGSAERRRRTCLASAGMREQPPTSSTASIAMSAEICDMARPHTSPTRPKSGAHMASSCVRVREQCTSVSSSRQSSAKDASWLAESTRRSFSHAPRSRCVARGELSGSRLYFALISDAK
eukprot:2840709-Pleurochrysis_carterae.AAC.2